YGFEEEGYALVEIIDSGYGYWVRSTGDGEITLSSSAPLGRVRVFLKPEDANILVLNNTTLYFGKDIFSEEQFSYSLPPKPPEGAFDVRFKDGWRLVKDYGEIEVMPTAETFTISYDIKIDIVENKNWVLTSENGTNYILEGEGEITVPSAERFTLELNAVVPAAFTLHQNFPNPFNPITTLRYDLPSDALVTLSIYDMLGREITQLVNTTQDAGFKSVQWDATDSMGRPVSAGVYLYQIQAGEFVQTKKMVLLK
ncbi:MAG: T9SS type A sorting domain-containing protein, partial [Dehalococcoidia bacterium]|nr:T9SS type A sorting domain-containing protein [Dehalococcoidia bacterium]